MGRMEELNGDDFIAKIHSAENWSLTWEYHTYRLILTTWERIPDSGRIHQSIFLGPDLTGMRHADFVVFSAQIENLLNGATVAEPKPDAPPAEGSEGAPERQDPEGRCGDWQDENRDGVL